MKTPNYNKYEKHKTEIHAIMDFMVFCAERGFRLVDKTDRGSGNTCLELAYKHFKINPAKLKIERAYLKGIKNE